MLKKLSISLIAVAGFVSLPAFAALSSTTLTGPPVTPTLNTDATPAGTLVADNSVTNGLYTINEAVYSTATGYDFYYQLVLASGATSVKGLSSENFSGATTSVGYDVINSPADVFANFEQPTSGGPTSASIGGPGEILWAYALGASSDSAVLFVATNATGYDSFGSQQANKSVGSIALNNTYEPAFVPEPGFYGALGVGLAFLWVGFRRRNRRQRDAS